MYSKIGSELLSVPTDNRSRVINSNFLFFVMVVIKKSFVEVFSDWKYILISFVIFVFFVSFSSLVINYEVLFNNFSLKLLFALFIGGLNSMALNSKISLFIISILTGILISMIVYKLKAVSEFKEVDKKTGLLGGVAVFFGIVVPTCSACGIGLLAVLGYGSLLTFLPFAGLEFAGLSIILLLTAIYFISRQIQQKTCKV